MRMLRRAAAASAAALTALILTPAGAALAAADIVVGSPQNAGTAPAQAKPLGDSALRLTVMQLASSGADETASDRAAVLAYFACTTGRAIWASASGPTAPAAAALAEIARADDWGLTAKDFALPSALAPNADTRAQAEFELKLSLAALKYARHARGGRIPDPPAQLASYLDRRPSMIEPATLLADLSSTRAPDAYLRALHPSHPQFELLRQQYLKIRGTAERSVTLPSGPALRPGETHAHVALLRKRLGIATAEGKSPEYYDEALAEAVRKFQKEKGLSSNGTFGSGTRNELNDGVESGNPAERLIANMEAWRWMPPELGDFHVAVNVPEFVVRVVQDGKVVHSERVVTGRKETQTPIFSDLMKTVVFQPTWGLPDSIKVNEVLPRLLRGDGLRSGYRMQRNGRDIDPEDVDWNKANILEYHVFQPSGDDNALGQVKFLFPNKHQVYMHDTPSKGLFRESVRTFSHGCVRVRNPVRLAEVLLEEDKGWDKNKVRVELEDKDENNRVALERRVPVHITYFTAAVDDSGKLQTFRDIYGHENRITLALAGRWKDIPKLPDHLAPVKVANQSEQAQRAKKSRPVQQVAEDDPPPKKRARVARAEEWMPPPPPRRFSQPRVVYVPPPSSYGPRYGLGRPVYQAQPKSFLQKLFGGGN